MRVTCFVLYEARNVHNTVHTFSLMRVTVSSKRAQLVFPTRQELNLVRHIYCAFGEKEGEQEKHKKQQQ